MSIKWQIRFEQKAQKEFEKLDRSAQLKIRDFLKDRLMGAENPRLLGKKLTDTLKEFWRYRVGDYRIICKIEDQELIILVLKVAHRRMAYKE